MLLILSITVAGFRKALEAHDQLLATFFSTSLPTALIRLVIQKTDLKEVQRRFLDKPTKQN